MSTQYLYFLSFLLLTLGSCDKNEEMMEKEHDSEPIVYVAGLESVDGEIQATLWKNGKAQHLTNSPGYDYANTVHVSNGDVYVSGLDYDENGPSPIVWKNGRPRELLHWASDFYGIATSIFVAGNDVHVSGYKYRINDSEREDYHVIHWENGIEHILGDDNYESASASAIHVSEGDVYILGNMRYQVSGRDIIYSVTLWKNGEQEDLYRGKKKIEATDVFVSEGDVYVVGYDRRPYDIVPIIWKNGVAHELENVYEGENPTDRAIPRSVYVSGEDVYVAGMVRHVRRRAVYWKNGNMHVLTDDAQDAEAESVFVLDGDVYVAGYKDYGSFDYVATLWKNGKPEIVGDESKYSKAHSVYVVKGE